MVLGSKVMSNKTLKGKLIFQQIIECKFDIACIECLYSYFDRIISAKKDRWGREHSHITISALDFHDLNLIYQQISYNGFEYMINCKLKVTNSTKNTRNE